MPPLDQRLSDNPLRERRMQTAKGELSRFLEAILNSTDQHVRRTFKGLIGSVHAVMFDDDR